MKVAIYSPYLDTASGGERYMLTIAELLSDAHQVDVLLDNALMVKGADVIRSRNELFHGINLAKVNFIRAPVGPGSNLFERLIFFRKYDVLVYNCDGSLFFSTARKNILHFQLPLKKISIGGLWGKLKLASWQLAIYNSKFTQEYNRKLIPIKNMVVYPPVAIEQFKILVKKKQIVSVGRFAIINNPKKQDLMIKTFRKMIDKGLKGWSLHLAGGLMEGNEQILSELKELAQNYPVYFYPNISLPDLVKLYGESSIYWHVMGYGETDPARFEHFGISTVEAMASGCVPVVIDKGGQLETVEDGVSGLFWEDPDQLIAQTLKIIEDPKLSKKLSEGALKRSRIFSKAEFTKQITKIVTI